MAKPKEQSLRMTDALIHAVLVFAAIGCVIALPAAAADVEHGRNLYETRCNVRHATGVHIRQARNATTFEGIREQVVRWNREPGGAWGMEEIDDVTVFLSDRYYLFRCPASVCRAGQANAG